MVTGVFDVDQNGNTVNYNLNGAQAIKITDYYNLTVSNGGLKHLLPIHLLMYMEI